MSQLTHHGLKVWGMEMDGGVWVGLVSGRRWFTSNEVYGWQDGFLW